MSTGEQSLQGLAWQGLVGIVSSLVVLIVADTFTVLWQAIVAALLVFGSAAYIVYRRNKRFIKLLRSGWAPGCYYTFPVEENPRVWTGVRRSLRYLGVSGASILDRFREWAQALPANSPQEFSFLLMDTEAKALPAQEAHRLSRSAQDPEVAEEVAITRQRIQTAIAGLKQLEAYKKGRLRIRLYDEPIPWWVYILDDDRAFVGVLEKGKSGLDSPVLLLKKHPEYFSIFDAFGRNWQRMWEQARDA